MMATSFFRRSPRSTGRRSFFRPFLEQLERRDVMSAPTSIPLNALFLGTPNETLNRAMLLGALDNISATPVVASIGPGPAGGADVDWFEFTVAGPTHIHLDATTTNASLPNAVLSLYDTDPGNTFDPDVVLTGHRLMQQVVGTGGEVTLDRDVAAGTYYVAVSGLGNQYFNPLIADSGLDGQTGTFVFTATGTTLTNPNFVLASDLDAVTQFDGSGNPVLAQSPLVLHFDLAQPLDPNDNVHLFDPYGNDLFPNYNVSTTTSELAIMPGDALEPNALPYEVMITNASDDQSNPLYTAFFVVGGIEGTMGATTSDDYLGGAHNLGTLTNGHIVQAAGTIGDDPYYDPVNNAGDPNLGNPSNQVDLYTFTVSGTQNVALAADAFAGRIGSPLNPSLTLFRLDDGLPVLIAGNDNTDNTTPTELDVGQTVPQLPLLTDAALFASLTPGEYVIAVSSGFNFGDPAIGQNIGYNPSEGVSVFDPTVSHSGTAGNGPLGNYVLNLKIEPASTAPQVVAVNISPGVNTNQRSTNGAPTSVDVTFSGPVNIEQLAFEAYANDLPTDLDQVFIRDANGDTIVPRFVSYDPTTFTAHFILLDRLSNGTYQLHLSGAAGLTDLAGTPLAGNTPGGDFVFQFTVNDAPARGLDVATAAGHDSAATAQNLGVVYAREFDQGFTVSRNFSTSFVLPTATADFYSFQVLQSADYSFFLRNVSGTVDSPELVDAQGNVLVAGSRGILNVRLDPGTTYYLKVGGWSAAQAGNTVYDLVFSIGTENENPPPLLTGPAPAVRLQLVSNAPTVPQIPPVLTLPTLPVTQPVAPTGGDTTTTSSTNSSLANLLPNVAFALGAGPIGGTRAPAVTADDSAPVVLLNLAPTNLTVKTASDGDATTLVGGTSDDDSINGILGNVGSTMTRLLDVWLQTRGLFLDASFKRSIAADSSEAQQEEPFPAPDEDTEEIEGLSRDLGQLDAFSQVADAPAAPCDEVWTAGLGFIGGLALLGDTFGDRRTRWLARDLRSPRNA